MNTAEGRSLGTLSGRFRLCPSGATADCFSGSRSCPVPTDYRKRHRDDVVDEIQTPNLGLRFGLVHQVAKSPGKQVRNDFRMHGWHGQSKVTKISDGEPALPNLVRRAVKGRVTRILDWWPISMRVQHIVDAVNALLHTQDFVG